MDLWISRGRTDMSSGNSRLLELTFQGPECFRLFSSNDDLNDSQSSRMDCEALVWVSMS